MIEVEKIKQFFSLAFYKNPDTNKIYFGQWVDRFSSPVYVWSKSDHIRRQLLIEMFPDTFGGLHIDTNLNNKEYQIKKFLVW